MSIHRHAKDGDDEGIPLVISSQRLRALLFAYGHLPAEFVKPKPPNAGYAPFEDISTITFPRGEWRMIVRSLKNEAVWREELSDAIREGLQRHDEAREYEGDD